MSVAKFRLLYIAALLIVLLIAIVTILPYFTGSSEFLFRDSSLTILYAALSLAIAMVTFGVLGDSGALVNYRPKTQIGMQISGSAAGFAIFYYLLSSGLNPYGYMDIYLHDEGGKFLGTEGGVFEVGLLGRVSQYARSDSGQFLFPIPRAQDSVRIVVKGDDGRKWRISAISPEGCVAGQEKVLASCSELDLRLSAEKNCLGNLRIVSHEADVIHTDLETVLDTLKENIQDFPGSVPVKIAYSPGIIKAGYLAKTFQLERKAEEARPVCEHLASIENRFNLTFGGRLIRTFQSCDTIYVGLTEEKSWANGADTRECLP